MDFTDKKIDLVWEKAEKIPTYDPSKYRKDSCGAWIARRHYGKKEFDSGWYIQKINLKGSDKIENLQALQWQNSVSKTDGKLACKITSNGPNNE